jgi:uncharacterized membrane protein
MIGLPALYALAGLLFAAFAIATLLDRAHPRRLGSAAFWGLVATSFLAGDHLGDMGNGMLVLAIVALAALGFPGRGTARTTDEATRTASAAKAGNRLFLPALIVPAVALAGTFAFPHISWGGALLVDAKQVTLVSLGLGAIIAVAVLLRWQRERPTAAISEGRRLVEAVGWALVLPQMLASLGAVFALAGIGGIVGSLAADLMPEGSKLAAVLLFTAGMAGFTMVMGNAFAAFPVMMAGIGLPVLIMRFGGNPAVVGAVGMLAGFCGTLLTPMAANFNMVPAALLELPDRNGVIRAQAPTAVVLWLFNTALIWGMAFR